MAGLGGFRTASRVSARDGASAAVGGQGQSERGNQVSVLVFNQHPFQARREEQSARHILAAARQNEICTLVWLDEGRQRLPAFEGDVRQIEPGLDVVQLGERCEVRAEQGEQLGIVWRDDWIRRVRHLAAAAGAGVGADGSRAGSAGRQASCRPPVPSLRRGRSVVDSHEPVVLRRSLSLDRPPSAITFCQIVLVPRWLRPHPSPRHPRRHVCTPRHDSSSTLPRRSGSSASTLRTSRPVPLSYLPLAPSS
jgi:hypothetical protein